MYAIKSCVGPSHPTIERDYALSLDRNEDEHGTILQLSVPLHALCYSADKLMFIFE